MTEPIEVDRGNQQVKGACPPEAGTALAPPSGVKPQEGLEQSRSSTGAALQIERMKRELDRQYVPYADFSEVSDGVVVIYHSPAVDLLALARAAVPDGETPK